MDNNISFTSKLFVKGNPRQIKELSEIMYSGILKKNRQTAQMEPMTPLRFLDLTEDKFAYERTALYLSGADVQKVKELESERTLARALGQSLPSYQDAFGKPDKVYDASYIIEALKNKALSIKDLISKE